MQTKLGKKFWISMLVFGLMGQVAWVVENMYFNVFIYKMFHASAADISLMVEASAIAARLTARKAAVRLAPDKGAVLGTMPAACPLRASCPAGGFRR